MNITVYCGSSMGASESFAQAAHELGAWIADSGHTLIYGGSSIGLMGIVSGTALERNGRVIGVEPRFFIEAGVEQHDLDELIVTETMSERKAKLIELGDAFIALPGGIGTLEEITEIISRIRLRLTAAPCIFLNIDGFYDTFEAFLDQLLAAGFLDPYEREAVFFCPTVADCTQSLAQWRLDQFGHDHPDSVFG